MVVDQLRRALLLRSCAVSVVMTTDFAQDRERAAAATARGCSARSGRC
jgi:hypothetical protein